MAYTKDSDGTIKDDESGDIIFFSYERFLTDICESNKCFMCGAAPEEKEFNEEHVIPKWILRKCGLFKQTIILPNGVPIRYDKYTVACCKECNSFLGKTIEKPVQKAVDGGLESVNNFVSEGGFWKIYIWLSLIFFKTHLKDSYLRKHLDYRKGNETIASDYDWSLMHHIHCIVRALKTGANIDPMCFGTTIVLPAKEQDNIQSFDYRDVYNANTILLRIGDIAFLSVLDDSCASSYFFSNHLERINAPLSPLQLREVLSHLTLLNKKLKYRPLYFTATDPIENKVLISVRLPDVMGIDECTREELGEILFENIYEYIGKIELQDKSFRAENIKKGAYSFLFDDKGGLIIST